MHETLPPLVSALIQLLQAIRIEAGLTLEQLADQAQVHRTTIGLLERAERAPSVDVAARIAKALGYPLSEIVAKAELIADGKIGAAEAFAEEKARILHDNLLRARSDFESFTALPSASLLTAIEATYHTLDLIDAQLIARDSPPIGRLVELANLSSMVGNLIGGALAEASNGLYKRNKPHHYPDLIPLRIPAKDLELKVALETNKPKGHLPKPGRYITFRYVLGDRRGNYKRGKDSRGDTVWFWEVKIGTVEVADFSISNTEGDSGKTAVIKTEVFNKMKLVFFDNRYCPHPMKDGRYPGHN